MQIGVSYFGNRILKHIKSDMKDLKQKGFTFVLHTYSEFDLMFRKGTMSDIVKATQDIGLKVECNPWGVGNVFGGEPFSQFVNLNYSSSCQVLDDGNVVPIACPNSPKFSDFMNRWVDSVLESGADRIFWDEPHFHEQGFLTSVPNRWGCRCKYCKSKFEEEFNKPMPLHETDEVKLFKKNSMIQFIESLSNRVVGGNRKVTLYLNPNLPAEKISREWSKYCEIDSVDTIATGPYWLWEKRPVKSVEDYSKALLELTSKHKKKSQIWIQGFKITAGKENEIAEAIDYAINAGIENIATWGYEGASQESWISCDNSELTWRVLLNSIRDIQNT